MDSITLVLFKYINYNNYQHFSGLSKTSSAASSKTSSASVVSNPKNPTKSVASAAVETAPLTGTLVSAGAVHSPEVFDMPVDPNEPTYCLCNQVSYGEMVGCDNPDVSIQILI